ncbi:MAG: flap endonuclease [Verrucomicrobiaceae bacterium]|nr:MAG: flap endonuclease [Verrucomicrobiaceae bacterium]
MRLLLVDGHYYLYRSFYAIRGLRNSRGEPTNAIYGYAKAIRKMLADLRPDRAAVIWDCGLPERRTTLQPEYKQNRTAMPDDLRPQEDWLQANIPLFGPASLSLQDTEADDLIASYALAAARDGAEVVIATNDKDILQLVSSNIRIYSTAKTDAPPGGFALLGESEVRAKWGVNPTQIADVLALTGDASDNIPGVPGIGEKTAVSLIAEHGSIENLLVNTAAISNPKLRDKIAASRGLITANREMVRLDEDLPLPADWSSFQILPRYPELIQALHECEFKGLLQEVEAEAGKYQTMGQQELF